MQTKLDEAEQQAVKGGRKVTSRLEQKIKDLESQFDDEQRRLVEAGRSPRGWSRRSRTLSPSSTMSSVVWWRLKSANAAPLGASRSSHSLKRRTTRTTSGCRSWWTSCRTRSRATRNRSRRLRRSPPSTSPSSARSRLTLSPQQNVLTSTSRCLPSTRLRQEAHLSDQTEHNPDFLTISLEQPSGK